MTKLTTNHLGIALAAAAALSAVAATPAAACAQEATQRVDTTFAFEKNGWVDVTIVTGTVVITGWTRPEARVIARLLEHGPQVLATGGGAVMDQRTRDLIRAKGISIWLKADLDVLSKRTKRRTGDRPLVDRIRELLPQREPIYALSDIVVQSRDEPHEIIVEEIIAELPKHLGLSADSKSEMKSGILPEMKS